MEYEDFMDIFAKFEPSKIHDMMPEKPKKKRWQAAAIAAGIILSGTVGYLTAHIPSRNELEQKNSKIAGIELQLKQVEEQHAILLDAQNAKNEKITAAEKKALEERIKSQEETVTALKKEIEEKNTEPGAETTGLRKQLEEKITALAILQDQIKKNDSSKVISRLTEENKQLQEEADKGKEELAKEKKACAEAMQELEQVRKSRLEEMANETTDNSNNTDSEYHERLQRDIELCTRIIASSHNVKDKVIGYTNRGNAKQRLGMYDAAIQDYDEALNLQPDYAVAYDCRGYAKYQHDQFKEALADLDKSLKLKPDSVYALNHRGSVKIELNLLEDAIRDFDRAIQLKSDDAASYYNRGNAKKLLGRLEEAIQDYDAALRIRPNDLKTQFSRKRAYDEYQEKNRAAEASDASENLSNEQREKILKDIELTTQIIRSLSTSLENRASGYNNRGNMKQRLGLRKEAIDDYNEAIRLRPNHAQTYSNRSVAKQHLGMLEEAIQDCDTAIKMDPTYAGSYFNRGNAKLKLGRLEDAIKDYDKVLELNPDYAMAEFARREAYEKLKEKDSSKKPVETYLAEAERYYRTGIIKLNLKLFNEALDALNKATELKPDFADTYHARSIVKYLLSEVPGTSDPAESSLHDKLRNEAIIDINAALQLKSDDFIALNNRACLFWMLHHRLSMDNFGCGPKEYAAFIKKIMQDFDMAIDLKPDFAKGYYNRGLFKCQEFYITAVDTLKVGKIEETILDFNKAIELNPNFAEAYHARGHAKDKSRSENQFNSKYTIEEITADIEKANKLKFSKGQYDSPDFILINPEQEKK